VESVVTSLSQGKAAILEDIFLHQAVLEQQVARYLTTERIAYFQTAAVVLAIVAIT